jgi:hypothetical protein
MWCILCERYAQIFEDVEKRELKNLECFINGSLTEFTFKPYIKHIVSKANGPKATISYGPPEMALSRHHCLLSDVHILDAATLVATKAKSGSL